MIEEDRAGEQARVAARSVLANIEELGRGGLDGSHRERVVELARTLSARSGPGVVGHLHHRTERDRATARLGRQRRPDVVHDGVGEGRVEGVVGAEGAREVPAVHGELAHVAPPGRAFGHDAPGRVGGGHASSIRSRKATHIR